jgi:hypothetical protein
MLKGDKLGRQHGRDTTEGHPCIEEGVAARDQLRPLGQLGTVQAGEPAIGGSQKTGDHVRLTFRDSLALPMPGPATDWVGIAKSELTSAPSCHRRRDWPGVLEGEEKIESYLARKCTVSCYRIQRDGAIGTAEMHCTREEKSGRIKKMGV